MKLIAITALLIALFLLYRIAFQNPMPVSKNKEDLSGREPEQTDDIIGKSRFVRSTKSQSTPNDDSPLNAVNQIEKADIFASETPRDNGVIPPEEVDELFDDTSDLEIEPDDQPDEDIEEEEIEEEAEELAQTLGSDAIPASGLTYEEMEEAIAYPSDENAETLCQIEQTDLFEQLALSNERKSLMIKAIIDRHIRKITTEKPEENNKEYNDYGDFDIADYVN